MSFLFGRARSRIAADLPKQARDYVLRLDGPNGTSKADELARVLNQMKILLQGTHETDSSPEQIYQLVTGLIDEDLLYLLASNLYRLPFESPIRLLCLAADAFTTFRELLTRHKELVPRYLSVNFDLFFEKYNGILIQSNSYVTKRQSIKLLGEILLDRSNYSVMTAYVDRGDHLKICMNLLRDDRKMVQYEGFHVFKVFVANPHKSIAVQKILLMNREKLLNFLSHFLEDRTDDEQFIDEREFLVKQIRNLPSNPIAPTR
ncbi:hypothetical protein CDD83_3616 [Cordyceps sp. RAO-2017]|nr:hypothetical protein CDD83_3616 [Cordyceps sp. RAO-2017]